MVDGWIEFTVTVPSFCLGRTTTLSMPCVPETLCNFNCHSQIIHLSNASSRLWQCHKKRIVCPNVPAAFATRQRRHEQYSLTRRSRSHSAIERRRVVAGVVVTPTAFMQSLNGCRNGFVSLKVFRMPEMANCKSHTGANGLTAKYNLRFSPLWIKYGVCNARTHTKYMACAGTQGARRRRRWRRAPATTYEIWHNAPVQLCIAHSSSQCEIVKRAVAHGWALARSRTAEYSCEKLYVQSQWHLHTNDDELRARTNALASHA